MDIRRGRKSATFLLKTHMMITNCDPKIAEWSDDGASFVIKDPDALSSRIIPQFFKHNNFSSFIRQLNLYGFRKFNKVDSSTDKFEINYWRFRHKYFLRGRVDLFLQITKPRPVKSNKQEIATLTSDVENLKCRVLHVSSNISSVKSTIEKLLSVTRVNTKEHKIATNQEQKRKSCITFSETSSANSKTASFNEQYDTQMSTPQISEYLKLNPSKKVYQRLPDTSTKYDGSLGISSKMKQIYAEQSSNTGVGEYNINQSVHVGGKTKEKKSSSVASQSAFVFPVESEKKTISMRTEPVRIPSIDVHPRNIDKASKLIFYV